MKQSILLNLKSWAHWKLIEKNISPYEKEFATDVMQLVLGVERMDKKYSLTDIANAWDRVLVPKKFTPSKSSFWYKILKAELKRMKGKK